MAKDNTLSMAYRVDALPRRIKKRRFFQTLMRAAIRNEPLPEGWQVTWIWRNHPNQDLREADFSDAVENSRAGFISLMVRRLQRDGSRFLTELRIPRIRKATKREIAQEEKRLEEAAAKRERKPGQSERARVRLRSIARSVKMKKYWRAIRRIQKEHPRFSLDRARAEYRKG